MLYEIPKTKKLYNGLASVRDYIVRDCLKKREPLKILYRGRTMTLDTIDKLRSFYAYDKRKFVSKIGGKPYRLVDYFFVPDKETLKDDIQLGLFPNEPLDK